MFEEEIDYSQIIPLVDQEIEDQLMTFFKRDTKKVLNWIHTPNPLLGNYSPAYMLNTGRKAKLKKFIKNQLSENVL